MFGSEVKVHRIALTYDQVERYDPPPNPAKTTDARYQAYAGLHGDESWELDALEPRVIVDLIREAVEAKIDQDLWQEALDRQQRGREQLSQMSVRWDAVTDFLDGDDEE
jgi:hypothetical protein